MHLSTVLFWIALACLTGFLIGCCIVQYILKSRRRRRGKPLVWRMLAQQWIAQQGTHHPWKD